MSTFKIEQTDSQCVVTWRHISCAVIPLLIFFTAWTAGSVFFTCMALFVEQDFHVFLFTLPFLAISFILFAVIANMLFGKTRLVLDENGFESDWTCLSIKREKHVELADIRRFETKVHRSRKGGPTYSLQVVLQERSTNFTAPADEKELNSLCKQLNVFLNVLKTGSEAGVPAQWEEPMPMVLAFNSSPQHLDPPPKNRWSYQADFNGFGFRFRDDGIVGSLFFTLFATAFWNGIVSVFVLNLLGIPDPAKQPEGLMWWFQFFFFIPFVLIGLLLVVVVFNGFLELFRRTTWRFAFGEAVFRTARIRSRIKHYDLTGWNSLAIRLVRADKSKEPENESELETFYEEGDHWQLAFLDKSDADLAVIEKLRKPEALWLTDVILRERRAIR